MKSAGKNVCQAGYYWWPETARVLVKECLDEEDFQQCLEQKEARVSLLFMYQKDFERTTPEEATELPCFMNDESKASSRVADLYQKAVEFPLQCSPRESFEKGEVLYAPLTDEAAHQMTIGAVWRLQREMERKNGQIPHCTIENYVGIGLLPSVVRTLLPSLFSSAVLVGGKVAPSLLFNNEVSELTPDFIQFPLTEDPFQRRFIDRENKWQAMASDQPDQPRMVSQETQTSSAASSLQAWWNFDHLSSAEMRKHLEALRLRLTREITTERVAGRNASGLQKMFNDIVQWLDFLRWFTRPSPAGTSRELQRSNAEFQENISKRILSILLILLEGRARGSIADQTVLEVLNPHNVRDVELFGEGRVRTHEAPWRNLPADIVPIVRSRLETLGFVSSPWYWR